MKTTAFMVIVFVCLGIIGGVFIFLSIPRSGTIDEHIPASNMQATTTLITPIASQVFTRASTAAVNSFLEIVNPTYMTEESRVKTSEKGRALIEGTHTIMLDHDTEIVIALADSSAHSTQLELEAGNLWSRVQKVLGHGEFFEIQTHNAVAAVRGTSFGVRFFVDTTTLFVVEGAVRFIAKNPATGELLKETEVLVGPGRKAIRKENGRIIIFPISDEDRASEWFRFVETYKLFGISSFLSPSSAPSSPLPLAPTPSAFVKPSPLRYISSSTPLPSPSFSSSPSPTNLSQKPKSSLRIDTISPSSVYAGDKNAVLEIKGSGYLAAEKVLIGNTQAEGLTIINDGVIRFRFPIDLSPNSYEVFVIDTGKHIATLPGRFIVKESPDFSPSSAPTPLLTPTQTPVPTKSKAPTPTPTPTYYYEQYPQ